MAQKVVSNWHWQTGFYSHLEVAKSFWSDYDTAGFSSLIKGTIRDVGGLIVHFATYLHLPTGFTQFHFVTSAVL
jgi:hypothetical protein